MKKNNTGCSGGRIDFFGDLCGILSIFVRSILHPERR